MERANISWKIAQAVAMYNGGTINIDVDAQRQKYQWTKAQGANLIHSAIEDYYIPPLVAWREETGEKRKGTKSTKIYRLLDGGQRMRTFVKFLNDEFELIDIPEVRFFSNANGDFIEYDANGKKFSELPEELQDTIKNAMLSVTYLDDCTQEEAAIMFRKLNNGKALSSGDKNIAYCNCLGVVKRIAKHEIFDKITSVSGKENRKHYVTTMKIWAMLNEVQPSFASKDMNKLMVTAEITPEEESEIVAVLDVANEVYEAIGDDMFDKKTANLLRRKIKSETHFVSLAPFFKKAADAIADGDEDMINRLVWFIHDFYGTETETSVSDTYNQACTGGSAKAINVARRNTALLEAWVNFFGNEEDGEDNDDSDVDDSEEEEAEIGLENQENDNADDCEESGLVNPENVDNDYCERDMTHAV